MAFDNVRAHSMYTPVASSSVAGEAIFSGCLCMIDFRRDAIASYIPAGVALPAGNSVSHACLLAFGEQADGTTFFGGFSARWGIRYHELMIAVPFVSWKGAAGRHLFVSGMTCDFWPAVWNGNAYYGFKKRFAPMGWNGDHFSVAGALERTGFDAVLNSRTGSPAPALERIRAAAALPVLGHRTDGVFVRSTFGWDFGRATIEGASLEIRGGEYLPELPRTAGSAQDIEACRVRGMVWRLGWPTPALQFVQ